jgi:hypothetical protein
LGTQSHVIGKGFEYRLKAWFKSRDGWLAERNPLSGASDQIEEELGKHDVRAWREDFQIFLQIECKKTNNEEAVLGIKKEWIDKINFNNDEFLVFSFLRCGQNFIFIPLEMVSPVVISLKKLETYKASGDTVFGFKKEWIADKPDSYCIVDFIEKSWAVFDLTFYIDYREKNKIETKTTNSSDKIKVINTVDELKKYREAESSGWVTKDWKAYYNKLDRLESGETSYNPAFIKEGQWWLPEDKKFDWNDNTIKSVMDKVQVFIDTNLEEEDEEIVWAYNKDMKDLEKEVRKILGLDKNKKGKDDSKSSK